MGSGNKMSRRNLLFGAFDKVRSTVRTVAEQEKPTGPPPVNWTFGYEPQDVANLEQGRAALAGGRYDEALNAFAAILEHRPGDNSAVLFSGLARARQGDLDGALDFWKLFLDFDKLRIQRELNVTIALCETGDRPEALAAAESVERAIADQEAGRGV